MKHAPQPRMTLDEFLIWSERQTEGRYELFDGEVIRQSHDGVSMQAETLRHVRVKGNAYRALHAAISAKKLPCEALVDGVTVKITDTTGYEPDVTVHCGNADPLSLKVDDPIIVVEVLSPGTATRDLRVKLEGYASVASIQHYLILDPDKPLVIHYARQAQGGFLARLLASGELKLDPFGLVIMVEDLFA